MALSFLGGCFSQSKIAGTFEVHEDLQASVTVIAVIKNVKNNDIHKLLIFKRM